VPEWSANMDGFRVKSEQIPNKDHKRISKFSNKSEPGYEITSYYICTCIEEYLDKEEEPGELT